MMRTLVVKRLSKSKKTFRNYTVRSEHIKSKYIAENLLHRKEKKKQIAKRKFVLKLSQLKLKICLTIYGFL